MSYRSLRRILFAAFLFLPLALGACGSDSAAPGEGAGQATSPLATDDHEVAEGMTSKAWQRIRDQAREPLPFEHVAELPRSELRDVYVAENTAQKLRGVFDAERLAVEPSGGDEAAWTLTLELSGWGRDDRPSNVSPATRELADNRLEYRRGDLVEWYRHDKRGIE